MEIASPSEEQPFSDRFNSNRESDTTGMELEQHVSLPENRFQGALIILDENKQRFLITVRDNVHAYIRSLGTKDCLSLVEIQKLHNTDGSITEQEIGRYPFSLWSLAFENRFAAFVSTETGVRPQYHGNTLDSSLSSPIRDQVLDEFKELYIKRKKEIAACLINPLILTLTTQAELARRVRDRLLDTKTQLSQDQLAFLNALDDKSIVDILLYSIDDRSLVERIRDEVDRATIEDSPELLESIDERLNVSLHQQTVQSTAHNVIGTAILSVVSSTVISMLAAMVGSASLAATTWYFVLPVLVSIAGGAYTWLQLPNDMAKKVSTAIYDQLDRSYHDYNHRILQALFEDVLLHEIDKLIILVANDRVMMDQARAVGNSQLLELLLETRFTAVTEGEMKWIRELDAMGLTRRQIAQLLLQGKQDAPWIFFEPFQTELVNPQIGHHVPGCVHRLFQADAEVKASNTASSELYPEENITTVLQQLCGLAGIAPKSRDRGTWNGSVRFDVANTLAVVSYARGPHEDISKPELILPRIVAVLRDLCCAFAQGQKERLCCDSFTILRYQGTQQSHDEQAIEMCRVDFGPARRLLEILEAPVDGIGSPLDTARLKQQIRDVLRVFLDDDATFQETKDMRRILSYCCLATQFLSIGFLSYIQAHIGAIEPFFLDTPLETIHLLGAETLFGEAARIQVSMKHLTCVGDMLRAPVVTFQLVRASSGSGIKPPEHKYDLFSNAEDLVETWGPAEFVFRRGQRLPFAIRIRGGLIYATNEEFSKYHWGIETADAAQFQGDMDPTKKVLVGSAVVVNSKCTRHNDQCWKASSTHLVQLKARRLDWEPHERQFGGAAGQYFSVQASTTYRRSKGQTLKEAREYDTDKKLTEFLDYFCGLQVSFCTGVCRRVTLREVVADLLPQFLPDWETDAGIRALKHAISTHNIPDLLRKRQDWLWLKDLDENVREYLFSLSREILNILWHTGISPGGNKLKIAWPNQKDRSRCFEVDCKHQGSWAPFLEDSMDCATFAYITTVCLETTTYTCGHSEAKWPCPLPALETSVVCVSTESTVLSHKSSFFLEKMDRRLHVWIDSSGESSTAKIECTTIPKDFIKRLIYGDWATEQLREKWSCVEDDFAKSVLTDQSY